MIVSGGSVSLMCFIASSNSTSPVGESSLRINFLDDKPLLRMPAFSSSAFLRSPNSIKMQPRKPLEMLSFQNDVYPYNMKEKKNCKYYEKKIKNVIKCLLKVEQSHALKFLLLYL